MSRTLTTRQAELAGQRAIRAVPLVTLVTYSDLYAGTVDTTYRWSDRTLRYGGVEYLADLVSLGPIRETMNHLPDSVGDASGTLRRELTITLRNGMHDSGEHLSEVLRGGQFVRARVTLSQLLLYADELGDFAATEALAGTEHVVLFRGEIREVLRVDQSEIELRCGSVLPQIPWVVVPDSGDADPKDVGKRLNLVYGKPKRVPVHNLVVGAMSTTVAPIGSDATTIEIADASRFSSAGAGMILYERIEWTAKYGTTHLLGVTRGTNGTTASQHLAGSIVAELPTEVVLGLGQGVTRCDALYVRNLMNDQLTRVSQLTELDTADTATISGATISTLTLTQDAMAGLVQDIVSQGRVTVQPSFASTAPSMGGATVTGPTDSTFTNAGAAYGTWASTGTATPYWASGGATRYVLRRTFTTSGLSGSDIVTRWRLKLRALFTGDVSTGAAIVMRCMGIPGIPDYTEIGLATSTTGAELEATSEWVSPPWGTVMTDLDTAFLDFYPHWNTTTFGEVWIGLISGAWGVEAEYTTTTQHYRTQDAEISAAAGGVGLDFYADLTGQEITYSVGSTTQLSSCDSTTGWAAHSTTTLSTTTPGNEGTGALRCVPNTTQTETGAVLTITSTDMRRKAVLVDVRMPQTMLDEIEDWYGVSLTAHDGTTGKWVNVTGTPVADTWTTYTFWLNDADHRASNGGLNDVTQLLLKVGHTAIATVTTHRIDFDNVRVTSAAVVWDAAPNIALRTPTDIVRHLHTAICGESTASFDDSAKATASSNLDEELELHMPLNLLGASYEDVIARIAFEGRCQFLLREGGSVTQIVPHAAVMGTTSYTWPAAAFTISLYQSMRERGREIEAAASQYRILYGREWSQDGPDAYRAAARVTKGVSDLTHAPTSAVNRAALGVLEDTLVFDGVQDDSTIDYVAGYYVRSGNDTPRILEVRGVPWVEAFSIERADIVSLTPTWASSAIKARVIEVTKDWRSQLIDLVVVEVT